MVIPAFCNRRWDEVYIKRIPVPNMRHHYDQENILFEAKTISKLFDVMESIPLAFIWMHCPFVKIALFSAS
jgi:hypothetical protein